MWIIWFDDYSACLNFNRDEARSFFCFLFMIYIQSDSIFRDQTYSEHLCLDTLENLLVSFAEMDLKVDKMVSREGLEGILNQVYLKKPFYIISHLPKEELRLINPLLTSRMDEPVVVSAIGTRNSSQPLSR